MSRRVLHLLAPAPFGGLERVVQQLALEQHARGSDVHVALLMERDVVEPPLADALERGAVPVRRMPTRRRGYAAQQALVRAALREQRPDVLHTHGYVADVMGALARRGTPVRHVSTVHGFTGGNLKNRCYEGVQCLGLRTAHGVIAVSAKLAVDLARRGVPPARVHTIPNAWRLRDTAAGGDARGAARDALGIGPDELLVGWVGRVSHEKGLDVLLDALPALADLPLTLVVAGDGAERRRLEARAATIGIASRVRWLGALPRADQLIPAFDVLVLSSRTEGTPMVLFEAIDAAVPVVATAVGGVPDVVSDSESLLVSPESPADLATAIRSVALDPAAARARARRARQRLVRDFAIDAWLARHDDVYDATHASPGGHGR